MEFHHLDLSITGRFSQIILDLLARDPFVTSLQHFTPDMEGLVAAAEKRKFESGQRRILCEVLREQYEGISISDELEQHLDVLAEEDTYTITTGHQLCLFTGPLYVPLKILNVVRLTREVSQRVGRAVVPIFWMATEDHDREEIDHVHLNGEKITWPGTPRGAVGRMKLDGIEPVIRAVEQQLGPGTNAEALKAIMRRCYSEERTLAHATRLFVNELFGAYGVICLDADDHRLKRLFLPYMRRELQEEFTVRSIGPQLEVISGKYGVQATPREINLFHLASEKRNRISRRNGEFGVVEEERFEPLPGILDELERYPEHFSPNVLLRPLYQEVILPNIAYVGGGGELAYWLQLKPLFEAAGIPMPVILLRTSLSILPEKEHERALDLGLSIPELLQDRDLLRSKVAVEKAGFDTSLGEERTELQQLFEKLKQRAGSIDPTLEGSAGSAASKALKALGHLEKRFIRVARKKTSMHLERLDMVLDTLFPGGGLQERRENFMAFQTTYGSAFFDMILEHLDPLKGQFTVMVDEEQV